MNDIDFSTIINKAPIMLFMKGDRIMPRCGFSAKVLEILGEYDIDFQTFDILKDEIVRQGLKTYSNWPTYPQLYINGELIGGCDIIIDMHQSGELKDLLK